MDKKQLLKYEKELSFFIHVTKVITLIALTISLILYAVAINSYFNHESLQAILFASFAFVLFHILRRYVVNIAKLLFKVRGGHDEMLQFIEGELNGRSQRDFFVLIEKAMVVIRS